MKHSLIFSSAILLLSLFQSSFAKATPSDEEIIANFQNRGRQMAEGLKIAGPELFPKINISLLEDAVQNTQVVVVKDKGFLNSRTASNFPGQHLIQIRRKHWLKAMELNSLVLHEYLGITGQESSETYSVSVEAVNLLRKRLFELQTPELQVTNLFLRCSENYKEKSHSIKRTVQYVEISVGMFISMLGGGLGMVYLPAKFQALSAIVGLVGTGSLVEKGNENLDGKIMGSYLGKNWAGHIYKLLMPSEDASKELSAFDQQEIKDYQGMTGDELTAHAELERRVAAILNYGDGSGIFCPVGGKPWDLNRIKQYVLQELSPLDVRK